MRRMLLLAGALLLAAAPWGAAPAQYNTPRAGYAGLFGGIHDPGTGIEGPGGYDHSACSLFVPQPVTDIEMWVWWLPDPAKGLMVVQFRIRYPASTYVAPGAVVRNPVIIDELGNLLTGVASTVGENCQYDWFWSHHQTITVKTAAPIGSIMIVPDAVFPEDPIMIATCEPGHPVYTVEVVNHLWLNQGCVIAVEDKTWGSIKSLYQ